MELAMEWEQGVCSEIYVWLFCKKFLQFSILFTWQLIDDCNALYCQYTKNNSLLILVMNLLMILVDMCCVFSFNSFQCIMCLVKNCLFIQKYLNQIINMTYFKKTLPSWLTQYANGFIQLVLQLRYKLFIEIYYQVYYKYVLSIPILLTT